jgi:hypothetical protein
MISQKSRLTGEYTGAEQSQQRGQGIFSSWVMSGKQKFCFTDELKQYLLTSVHSKAL